jgi:phosphoglucomutase
MRFDAMHAVTGPYAVEILENRLGAEPGTVMNGEPLEDFGGGHPDPNLVHAHELVELTRGSGGLDFGAASDGDGDRNMILGRGLLRHPSDSLAVLAANAHLAPGYKAGIAGVARSMPTSQAADRVAEELGVDCYETPTGWKFFGNLLDAGASPSAARRASAPAPTMCARRTASGRCCSGSTCWRCAKPSAATSCASTGAASAATTTPATTTRRWTATPRRPDGPPAHPAAGPAGQAPRRLTVAYADDFSYTDPVDGSVSAKQGIRIGFEGGSRIVMRLSGTGTQGATLRVYIERYEPDPALHDQPVQEALAPLIVIARELAQIEARTGRAEPDVVT